VISCKRNNRKSFPIQTTPGAGFSPASTKTPGVRPLKSQRHGYYAAYRYSPGVNSSPSLPKPTFSASSPNSTNPIRSHPPSPTPSVDQVSTNLPWISVFSRTPSSTAAHGTQPGKGGASLVPALKKLTKHSHDQPIIWAMKRDGC
jgi:hypothetical protein